MTRNRAGLAVAIGMLLVQGRAIAADYFEDRITVNAYGTLGVAMTSDSDSEMFRTIGRNGPPLTKDLSTNFDSRLGLQIEAHASESVDIVWQGLLHRNLDDETRVETKWAYLRLRPRPWLDIKLGRYLIPFYQISDQLYVGYAHPWARPPSEVYGQTDEVDHAEGISARASGSWGELNYTAELTWGQYEKDTSGSKITVEPRTLGLTLARNNWSLRGMVANAPTDLEFNGAAAFNALLNAGQRHRYNITGEHDVWYYNLGYIYEDAEWLLQSEAVVTDLSDNHAISETQSWSLTLGRHLGSVMPYATYSRLKVRNDEAETAANPFVEAAINGLINNRLYDQATATIGARWDFRPGYALKLQADSTRVDSGSRGLFSPAPDDNVRSYSLILDWVW